MVSRNLSQAHLLEVSLTKIPGDHETLSKICHVGLHVTSHPWSLLWDFRPSCVKWTWTVSTFRPMRALRLQWSRAFSLVCEVALSWDLLKRADIQDSFFLFLRRDQKGGNQNSHLVSSGESSKRTIRIKGPHYTYGQGPWPWNCEDSCNSSEGCIMHEEYSFCVVTKSSRAWSNIHCMPCRTQCRYVISVERPWSRRPSSSSVKRSGTNLTFCTNARL